MSETSVPLVIIGVGVLGTYYFSGLPQKIAFTMIPVGVLMLFLSNRS